MLPANLETIKGQPVTCAAPVTVNPHVGSTGAAVNGTTVNALAGHDPGEAIMGATDLDAALAAIAGYIDTEVATLLTNVGTLLTRLGTPGNLGSGATVAANLADIDTAVGAISSGSGSGARTVTITVNDGATVLENAKVRMTNGAESYVVSTNVSGVAVFSLDDATWSVAITKPGYTFTPTTRLVDGTETQTYSMTALVITPSDPDKVTGYVLVYDSTNTLASGIILSLTQTKIPSDLGVSGMNIPRLATSNGSGVAQWTNLLPGSTVVVRRGNGEQIATVTIPANASDPYLLGSTIGKP
jgi:hypothetical protein